MSIGERERGDLRRRNTELETALRRLEVDHSKASTEIAVLERDLFAIKHVDRLRGVMQTVGGLFGGTAVSLVIDPAHWQISLLFGFLGVAFLIGGWMWPLPKSGGR